MGGRYIADAVEDTLKPPGEFPLPGFKHVLDHGPLEVILGTAELTGDDGEITPYGVLGDVFLLAVSERADHHMVPVIAQELRWHGLQFAAKE